MAVSPSDDSDLVAKLRRGDEAAFTTLVDRYSAALRRLARSFVSTDAAADEVVQDTWVAVLDGLDTFQERSLVKTWIFRILVNRAKTKGVRDARMVPGLDTEESDSAEAAVDPCLQAALRRQRQRQSADAAIRTTVSEPMPWSIFISRRCWAVSRSEVSQTLPC